MTLAGLVAAELAVPVDPRVTAMAEKIAARHPGARAVLFYGSCLREEELDGRMLDFYLIVGDYARAYDRRWLAAANRLIPPNVFPFAADGLSAKYAVLSEADFARECGPGARTVSTVARFAQPTRLAWSADEAAREAAIAAIAQAAPTLIAWILPVATDREPPARLFEQAFEHTFAAELRAERSDRTASIVAADRGRYDRFAQAALAEIGTVGHVPREQAERWWRKMQRRGKRDSVLRLAKASLTFAGGVDYILWKINRHAGTSFTATPWQRRWPLLAAISLLPRLLRSGAVR